MDFRARLLFWALAITGVLMLIGIPSFIFGVTWGIGISAHFWFIVEKLVSLVLIALGIYGGFVAE